MANNNRIKATSINLNPKGNNSGRQSTFPNPKLSTTNTTPKKDEFGFSNNAGNNNQSPQQKPTNNNNYPQSQPNNSVPTFSNNSNSTFPNYPGSSNLGNNQWGNSSNNNLGQYQPNSYMDPEKRIEFINKAYQEILGRDPEKKDLNYYKYSTLNEDQIRQKLLTSEEHTNLIKNGRQFSEIKNQKEELETQCKSLESKIEDQLNEFQQLNILLRQKNEFIARIRENQENPTNQNPETVLPRMSQEKITPDDTAQNNVQPPLPPSEESSITQNSTVDNPEPLEQFTTQEPTQTKKKPTLKEKLIKLLS